MAAKKVSTPKPSGKSGKMHGMMFEKKETKAMEKKEGKRFEKRERMMGTEKPMPFKCGGNVKGK